MTTFHAMPKLGFSLFDLLILGMDILIDKFYSDKRINQESENGVATIKVNQSPVGFNTGYSNGSGITDLQ